MTQVFHNLTGIKTLKRNLQHSSSRAHQKKSSFDVHQIHLSHKRKSRSRRNEFKHNGEKNFKKNSKRC